MPVFPVDDRGYYHHMMSLIISQRIRFRQGQKIRSKIYALQGRSDLLRIAELTVAERAEVGLGANKWVTIVAFHTFHENHKVKVMLNPSRVSVRGPYSVQKLWPVTIPLDLSRPI